MSPFVVLCLLAISVVAQEKPGNPGCKVAVLSYLKDCEPELLGKFATHTTPNVPLPVPPVPPQDPNQPVTAFAPPVTKTCAERKDALVTSVCAPLLADILVCAPQFVKVCPALSPAGGCVIKQVAECVSSQFNQLSTECQNTVLVQRLQQMASGEPAAPPVPGVPPESTVAYEEIGRPDAENDEDDDSDGSNGWRRHVRFHKKHWTWKCALKLATMVLFVTIGAVWLLRERARRAALRRARNAQAAAPTGTWSTGLFGSWQRLAPDWKTCLPSFLFPAFQTSLNQAELEDRDCAVADVCLNVAHPLQWANVYRDRQTIRSEYAIPTASCADCLASVFCTRCAIAQNAREIDMRAGVGQGQQQPVYHVSINEDWDPATKAAKGPTEQQLL